jgi:hypothetical protein
VRSLSSWSHKTLESNMSDQRYPMCHRAGSGGLCTLFIDDRDGASFNDRV